MLDTMITRKDVKRSKKNKNIYFDEKKQKVQNQYDPAEDNQKLIDKFHSNATYSNTRSQLKSNKIVFPKFYPSTNQD